MVNGHSERGDSLWWVAAAPAIWAAHFTLSYATAAVWCAKNGREASLGFARGAIAVFTGLGLVAILVVALRGLRNYRAPNPVRGGDTSEARHHFVGFTLLALSGLTALALIYEALTVVFVRSCH